eukprot:gene15909-22043_t
MKRAAESRPQEDDRRGRRPPDRDGRPQAPRDQGARGPPGFAPRGGPPMMGPLELPEEPEVVLEIPVHRSQGGLIIGPGGESAAMIRKKARVQVHVRREVLDNGMQIVELKGSSKQCLVGVEIVRSLLRDKHPEVVIEDPKNAIVYFEVLPEMVGSILGSKGSTIRQIRDKTRCTVKIGELLESGLQGVTVGGTIPQVKEAYTMIRTILQKFDIARAKALPQRSAPIRGPEPFGGPQYMDYPPRDGPRDGRPWYDEPPPRYAAVSGPRDSYNERPSGRGPPGYDDRPPLGQGPPMYDEPSRARGGGYDAYPPARGPPMYEDRLGPPKNMVPPGFAGDRRDGMDAMRDPRAPRSDPRADPRSSYAAPRDDRSPYSRTAAGSAEDNPSPVLGLRLYGTYKPVAMGSSITSPAAVFVLQLDGTYKLLAMGSSIASPVAARQLISLNLELISATVVGSGTAARWDVQVAGYGEEQRLPSGGGVAVYVLQPDGTYKSVAPGSHGAPAVAAQQPSSNSGAMLGSLSSIPGLGSALLALLAQQAGGQATGGMNSTQQSALNQLAGLVSGASGGSQAQAPVQGSHDHGGYDQQHQNPYQYPATGDVATASAQLQQQINASLGGPGGSQAGAGGGQYGQSQQGEASGHYSSHSQQDGGYSGSYKGYGY